MILLSGNTPRFQSHFSPITTFNGPTSFNRQQPWLMLINLHFLPCISSVCSPMWFTSHSIPPPFLSFPLVCASAFTTTLLPLHLCPSVSPPTKCFDERQDDYEYPYYEDSTGNPFSPSSRPPSLEKVPSEKVNKERERRESWGDQGKEAGWDEGRQ